MEVMRMYPQRLIEERVETRSFHMNHCVLILLFAQVLRSSFG